MLQVGIAPNNIIKLFAFSLQIGNLMFQKFDVLLRSPAYRPLGLSVICPFPLKLPGGECGHFTTSRTRSTLFRPRGLAVRIHNVPGLSADGRTLYRLSEDASFRFEVMDAETKAKCLGGGSRKSDLTSSLWLWLVYTQVGR